MRSVRLLPVVIFAALALLLFKGIGLVTNGGYVLTGSTAVLAAGGEAPAEGAAGDLGGGLPGDVELSDTSPTIEDGSPTMATSAGGGDHGAAADESHGSAEADHGSEAATVDSAASSEETASGCPEGQTLSVEPNEHGGDPVATCVAEAGPVDEHGDAIPLTKDGTGKITPLTSADENSEDALVARLGERRAELDKREADIAMRLALVEAAEKRLDERAQELAALEARVAALVDEKQAAEDAGFKAIVSMYETMKPKDAAKIFDTLKLSVLLKVARAMSPRKMSPVLAAMSAEPAQLLTTALAATESTDVVAPGGENLAQLPQIVGQ